MCSTADRYARPLKDSSCPIVRYFTQTHTATLAAKATPMFYLFTHPPTNQTHRRAQVRVRSVPGKRENAIFFFVAPAPHGLAGAAASAAAGGRGSSRDWSRGGGYVVVVLVCTHGVPPAADTHAASAGSGARSGLAVLRGIDAALSAPAL